MIQVTSRLAKGTSIFLAALMVFVVLPGGALKADAAGNAATLTHGGASTGYAALQSALSAAQNGDTVTLNRDDTETVSFTARAGSTVVLDGGGHTLTGTAGSDNNGSGGNALDITGAGVLALKNITLRGGQGGGTMGTGGNGINADDSFSGKIAALGNVAAAGGNGGSSAGDGGNGVYSGAGGTIDVGTATGGSGTNNGGFGVYNNGAGTVNAGTATGGGATNLGGYGVVNVGGGTVNADVAQGGGSDGNGGTGVYNYVGGTVNVGTAQGGASNSSGGAGNNGGNGVYNWGGTVNVRTAQGGDGSVGNSGAGVGNVGGTVNVGTAIGGNGEEGNAISNLGGIGGTVSVDNVRTVVLHANGGGIGNVLTGIVVAASGETSVGTLPVVIDPATVQLFSWYCDELQTSPAGAQIGSDLESLYAGCFGISLSAPGCSGLNGQTLTLPAATAGYGAQNGAAVTATNTGTGATGSLAVTLSDTSDFTLSPNGFSGIALGGTAAFTIAPVTGLGAGTYTATVTVGPAGGNPNALAAQSFTVRFTVGAVAGKGTPTVQQTTTVSNPKTGSGSGSSPIVPLVLLCAGSAAGLSVTRRHLKYREKR